MLPRLQKGSKKCLLVVPCLWLFARRSGFAGGWFFWVLQRAWEDRCCSKMFGTPIMENQVEENMNMKWRLGFCNLALCGDLCGILRDAWYPKSLL